MAKMHDDKLYEMVRDIHTAMFGRDGNSEYGIFHIAQATQKRVDRLETKLVTIWAVVISIPLIAGILAFFGISPVASATHQIDK